MSGRSLDFAALFAALPSPHLVVDLDLVVVAANSACIELVGLPRHQVVGRPVSEVFPASRDAVDGAGDQRLGLAFDDAARTGRPTPEFIAWHDAGAASPGGAQEGWWSHLVVPVLDAAGAVESLLLRVDHVRSAPAEALGGRSAADGSPTGAGPGTTGDRVVREGQDRTARVLDAMPSGFLSLDTSWRFTLVNPAAEQLLGRTRDELLGRTMWEAYPATVGSAFERGYREAVETGTPTTIHAYYPAPLDAWYDVLCWPSADGLSLFFSDVTARTRSDQRAEATARRLALLAEVSDALAEATDASLVLDDVTRMLTPAVADSCLVTTLGPDGKASDVSYWHSDPELRADFDGYARTRLVGLAADAPFAQVLHSGQARHLTAEQIAAVRMDPQARAHLDALGPTRGSIVPLRAPGGRPLGALTLLSSAARPRDLDMEATASTIADRVGAALETSRLTTARTQLVEDLQRSLLTAPPEPDHAQIVVRYQPAAEAARVGGDWYDAFLQPDGSTMIVIGDVVGHDTVAAAAMGQLRGLLRGIATYSHAGPAEVLRGLDASMQVLQIDTLATATVARFEQTPDDVDSGLTRMLWANAGHPDPLVIHPGGSVQVLATPKADLLLGVDPGTRRTEQVTTLDRGATVLLYTDGLVERRDADLDDGLERLTAVLTDLADASLDDLCDGVLRRMVDGHPDDDVALVAVRLHRPDRPRQAGARRVPEGLHTDR